MAIQNGRTTLYTTYYLANLAIGEDGTLTATYQRLSSIPEAGRKPPTLLADLVQQIPTTLVQMSLGGPTPSSTPEEVEAGEDSTERDAGGGEACPVPPRCSVMRHHEDRPDEMCLKMEYHDGPHQFESDPKVGQATWVKE